MIHTVTVVLTLDTRTNKIVIEGPERKRIVIFPAKKMMEHWVDVIIDDRPTDGPFSYAKDICKLLCQNLPSRKHYKKIITKSLGPPDTGFKDG